MVVVVWSDASVRVRDCQGTRVDMGGLVVCLFIYFINLAN